MWAVTHREVRELKNPGGDEFADFVNALLFAHTRVAGVPRTAIHANLRTQCKDGGVDAAIDVGIPGDVTGLFEVPTCIQFKAGSYADLNANDYSKLRGEIRKGWYVHELLRRGYGYVFVICDDLPPEVVKSWQEILTIESRMIYCTAPEAKVVATSRLGDWASSYPAVAVKFFKPELENFLPHGRWRAAAVGATGTYVPVANRSALFDRIAAHVDFQQDVHDVVLPIQGESGIGKTRLVYEALGDDRLRCLVGYTREEDHALNLAQRLLLCDDAKAVLVADECSLRARDRLRQILRNVSHRVRVLTIENEASRRPDTAPETWLRRVDEKPLLQILEQNFPAVPQDHQRTYARSAEGFVRLAVDLCDHDQQIAASGRLDPGLVRVRDFFDDRLENEQDRVVVGVLALVRNVGYRDEVRDQLEALCASLADYLNMNRVEFVRRANRMRDVPGFTGRAGRFFYSTPDAISRVALEHVWENSIEPDLAGFLQALPPRFLQAFREQVSELAPPAFRAAVSGHYAQWAGGLEAAALADREVVLQLSSLVETDPQAYLAVLERLVSGAQAGETRAYCVGILIPLLARVAAFEAYFPAVERILLRFALDEPDSERAHYGARGIWAEFFRLLLPGTAAPFADRLALLEERVFSDDLPISVLARSAIGGCFAVRGARMASRDVIAGQLTPRTLHVSWGQARQCMQQALGLLGRMAASDRPELADAAANTAIENMREVLRMGLLPDARTAFCERTLSENLPCVVESVEDYFRYDHEEFGRLNGADYETRIRTWLTEIVPQTLAGRLREVVGQRAWHYKTDDSGEPGEAPLRELAQQAMDTPDELRAELGWLSSDQAKSAREFGTILGELDGGATLLEATCEAAPRQLVPLFACGYLRGLLTSHAGHAGAVADLLTRIEPEAPELANRLGKAVPEYVGALGRTLRLVVAGLAPPRELQGYGWGIGTENLTREQLCQILTVLAGVEEGRRAEAQPVAVSILSTRLRLGRKAQLDDVLAVPEVQDLAWALLEGTADHGCGNNAIFWKEVATGLVPHDPARAAAAACRLLQAQGLYQQREAREVLQTVSGVDPNATMQALGAVILSENGWRIRYSETQELFTSLPLDVVGAWLLTNGASAAQGIAAQLPAPTILDGQPTVHELTLLVLLQFEDDDETFLEFCRSTPGRSQSGELSEGFEADIRVGREFLDHPLRRIREWADLTVRSAEESATRWRQIEEEGRIR